MLTFCDVSIANRDAGNEVGIEGAIGLAEALTLNMTVRTFECSSALRLPLRFIHFTQFHRWGLRLGKHPVGKVKDETSKNATLLRVV